MHLVILSIIGMAAFVHILKFAQWRGHRVFAAGAVNYAFGALTAILFFQANVDGPPSAFSLVAGMAVGAVYVSMFTLMHLGIAGSGVSLTAVMSNISVVIPLAASIFFWGEWPDTYRVLGMLLVLIAIPLIGFKPAENPQGIRKPSFWILAVLFLASGMSGTMMKASAESVAGNPSGEHAFSFIMGLFISACIVSAIVAISLKQLIRWKELASGTVLGGANMLANLPVLLALSLETGTIVFATRTGGALLVTVIVSRLLWKEKLLLNSKIGIAISVIALLFVNMPTPVVEPSDLVDSGYYKENNYEYHNSAGEFPLDMFPRLHVVKPRQRAAGASGFNTIQPLLVLDMINPHVEPIHRFLWR